MKNSKILIRISLFTIGTLMLLTAVILFPDLHSGMKEKNEYNNAGGRIVVIFNQAIQDNDLQTLAASMDSHVKIVRHIGDYALFHVNEEEQYYHVINQLKKNPSVKVAQADSKIITTGVTNDAYSNTQWPIENPGHYTYISEEGRMDLTSTEDVDMNVAEAWDQMDSKGLAKRQVIVAVIDTGVDIKHPDLESQIWENKNEIPNDNIDNDGNGYIDDVHGWDFYNQDETVVHYKYNDKYKMYLSSPDDTDDHGTHVAGIIGAVANNKIGIAGVASNVDIKIMPLKINGGPKSKGDVSSAIEAIKYATMMGADICNLSWGTTEDSEALKQVIKESNMLFVVAAGNSGNDINENPMYPASYDLDNLISVAYINSYGNLARLSNYGNKVVDLAAPGEDILSTVVGSYGTMSGSSMAAPQVTGVAAMLYAEDDHLFPSNVKKIIMNNIKHLSNLDGYLIKPGIPDANLDIKDSESLTQDTIVPHLKFETDYNKSLITVTVNAVDKGGSGLRVVKWMFGNKSIEDFQKGYAGSKVEDGKISVSKAGTYTFYAADYAGNETLITYGVKDDKMAPKISSSYTISDTYKYRTVSVRIAETQSGIKRVKYMEGKKKAEDFLPSGAGTEVALKDNKGNFTVKKDGIYTIFASDNRGNLSVSQIEVKTVRATELKFVHSNKTLYIGDQYYLIAFLKPIDTTDKVTYSSSNYKVASVTSTGRINALAEGNVIISARTTSGLMVKCLVTVKKNGS